MYSWLDMAACVISSVRNMSGAKGAYGSVQLRFVTQKE